MSVLQYPAYQDSGLDWVGDIPTGWTIKPLWAISTCNDDVLSETAPPDYRIRYIEISDVDAVKGVTGATEVDFGEAPSRARRKVRDGDVIVSTVRTYLRAIASIREPTSNTVVSTGFAVMRPKSVHSTFLAYLFRSEFLISEIIAKSVGISYPAINAGEIGQIRVPLPPAAEQISIGTFLDRETGKIDALMAEQERLIALLKEKRQAAISQAVTKGLNPGALMKPSGLDWLGEMPTHWQLLPIKALFRFVKRQNNDAFEVLSVYRDFGVIPKDSRTDNINKTPEDLSSYQTVYPGDLVINKMKSWQGSLGISDLMGITSPDYAVFAPVRSLNSEYLNWLLRCNLLPGVYRSISNGIRPDQWRLEPDRLQDLQVPYPPSSEQAEVAIALRETAAKYDGLAAEAGRAITLLKERRSALISAAVTGKIDVRNLVQPSTELASAA